LSLNMNLLESI